VATEASDGIVNIPSQRSVDDVVHALTDVLQSRGITLFAIIDHSGEAEKVGITMRPTKLVIFGSPKGGSPVMIAAPGSALDLPLKVLVWQDAEGQVWVSYNSPQYLQERHHIPPELARNLLVIEALAAAAAH
jgi:uncharacterized protein (DUF302 family)